MVHLMIIHISTNSEIPNSFLEVSKFRSRRKKRMFSYEGTDDVIESPENNLNSSFIFIFWISLLIQLVGVSDR